MGGLDFWGQSFISDPCGTVVKKASEKEEEVLIYPVDLSLIHGTRDALAHSFRDRRNDSYGGLAERYLDRDG